MFIYQISNKFKADHSTDLNSLYVRRHVPTCDYTKEEFVLNLEISLIDMEFILSNIRDEFIKSTEINAFSCVEKSIEISVLQKLEFTETLEERLRNHW